VTAGKAAVTAGKTAMQMAKEADEKYHIQQRVSEVCHFLSLIGHNPKLYYYLVFILYFIVIT